MKAIQLRQPYIKAIKAISEHIGNRNDIIKIVSIETKVCEPTLRWILLGRFKKFDSAEAVIDWGVKNKIVKL